MLIIVSEIKIWSEIVDDISVLTIGYQKCIGRLKSILDFGDQGYIEDVY